ncbi:MAG: hypothetical protein IJZ23_03015 [Roseburia sp.]|nr:hypothetical protein [Roseburia sp.]
MKNRTTILNSVLAAVLGVVLLVSVIVKTVCPHFILPEINIPYIVAVSLVSLVLTHFVKTEEGCPICQAILAAVTFAILPWAAGLATVAVWKLAIVGGIVFAVLNAMFTAMVKRMELADICKGAVIPAAFGLYLACQCFTGWIL